MIMTDKQKEKWEEFTKQYGDKLPSIEFKNNEAWYYWQSSFIDCFNHSSVIVSFIWENLSKYNNKEGSSLRKYYKSCDVAIGDLMKKVFENKIDYKNPYKKVED